jgi:GDP-mannose 6-dehydrogenase
MAISVFGLGYVGAIASTCLANDGFSVIGVDINPDKVASISRGLPPVIESGLEELLASSISSGRLKATTSTLEAVQESDLSLICVGTPNNNGGAFDLSSVYSVCEEIAQAIRTKNSPHMVAIRSTVIPGTTENCARLLTKHSGGQRNHIAFIPEFLREGCGIEDYYNPPFILIGTRDPKAESISRKMFSKIAAPIIVTKPKTAEMVKLASNAWHATKITFANEIGRIADLIDADGTEIMEILTKDTKLNISARYMRPGFAYGGSCLPKDVRALNYFGRIENVELPLLNSLEVSNLIQIDLAVKKIIATGKRRIGLMGLAFKAGTDDLRESPYVELAERLLGKGYNLKILDKQIQMAKLFGTNEKYIEKKIPHLSALLANSDIELLDHAEVLVITQDNKDFRSLLNKVKPGVISIDLTGGLNGTATESFEIINNQGINISPF